MTIRFRETSITRSIVLAIVRKPFFAFHLAIWQDGACQFAAFGDLRYGVRVWQEADR